METVTLGMVGLGNGQAFTSEMPSSQQNSKGRGFQVAGLNIGTMGCLRP